MATTDKNGDYPAISQLINAIHSKNSKNDQLNFWVFQILYSCKDELGLKKSRWVKKTKTKHKNQTFLFSLIVFVIDDHQVAAAELNQGHLGAEGQIRTRPGWDSVHLVGDKPAGLQPSADPLRSPGTLLWDLRPKQTEPFCCVTTGQSKILW